MTAPLRLDAGELTAEEIIEELTAGRRILVSVELLSTSTEVSLRYDGDIYYCDTPTQLHKHSDEDEMRDCIEEMGYAADEGTSGDDDGGDDGADGVGDDEDDDGGDGENNDVGNN